MIGADFITRHKVKIDLANKKIDIHGQSIPLKENSAHANILLLKVVDITHIAPNSEKFLKVRSAEGQTTDFQGFVEGNEVLDRKELLAAKGLAEFDEYGETWIRIANLSDTEKVLHKDELVGEFTPITDEIDITVIEANSNPRKGSPSGTDSSEEPPIAKLQNMIAKFKLDDTKLTSEQKLKVARLLVEHEKVISQGDWDLGKTTEGEFKIELTDEFPIREPVRKIAPQQRDFVSKTVNELLEKDLIEPSESEWSCPIVLARKKSGEWRFCCDYRKLNDKTKKDSFPLPLIQESLESLAGNAWFCTLDMVGAYWSVPVRQSDKEKLAFRTHDGLFHWKVLPFGVANGPACFQRIMHRVLGEYAYKFALLYLDDVICYGKTFEDTFNHLGLILGKLEAAGMKIKPEKTQLFRKQVTFLGHEVCEHGIRTSPDKIQKVQEWPQPKNITELRGFLGLAGYYRRFINKFAQISEPLNNLTRKDIKFEWTPACQKAFETLKEKLTSSPLLSYPRFDKDAGKFILDVDASDQAVGGNLLQLQDGKETVIAYASQAMNEHQKNYCTTMKEMLALVQFLEHYRPYLVGKKFLVRTDHSALQWIRKCRGARGILGRWNTILDEFPFDVISRMEEYEFDIQYRPGEHHGNADALSRRPARDGPPKKHHEECPSCKPSTVRANAVGNVQPRSVAELQDSDPDIAELKELVAGKKDCPPKTELAGVPRSLKSLYGEYENLLVIDGVLYRRWVDQEGRQFDQIVLPTDQEAEQMLFRKYHDDMAHCGIQKTRKLIRSRYWWPNYATNLDRYIKTCPICQAMKKAGSTRRAPLEPELSSYMGEKVHLDFAGPFPETSRGNKYLLIMIDHFTGWTEAKATKTNNAEDTAWAFYTEWIARYGSPEAVITDRGANFTSEIMKEIARKFGADLRHTTSYHPQSNGKCERAVGIIKNSVRMISVQQKLDWDLAVPHAVLVHRGTVNDSTGFTPFELVFARKIRLPVDAEVGLPPFERHRVDTYVNKLYQDMTEAHQIARVTQGRSQARQKTNFDTKVFTNTFKERDWVWIANPEKTPSQPHRWFGPYIVLKTTDQGKCLKVEPGPEVKGIPRPTGIHPVVTIDRVKPFYYANERTLPARGEEEEPQRVEVEQGTRRSPVPTDAPEIQFVPLGTRNIQQGLSLGETIFLDQTAQRGDSRESGTPQTIPADTQLVQSSPQTTPVDTQSAQGSPQTIPIDGQSAQSTPQTILADTQSVQSSPQTNPAGAQSGQSSPQTIPAGAQTSEDTEGQEVGEEDGFETAEEEVPAQGQAPPQVLRRSKRTIRKPRRYEP
ncbi:MAG: reverse transcriptase domain-containing protein [Kangiellaceae bacterium]|nr:reverse transcriptase domain-containing protein [Kangiellaceae bacterium]